VLSYRPLAAALADDQPVYGIQSEEPETIRPGDVTIESMAAKYVAAIKTVVPAGPYMLGGFCGGATLAFEMAQQLRQRGERVILLAVIDHWLTDAAIEKRSIAGATIDFLRNLPLWLMDDLRYSSVREISGRVRSHARRLWAAATRRYQRAPNSEPRDIRDMLGLWRLPANQVPILEAYYRAFETYMPRPYPGPVTVFRPRAMPLVGHRLRSDLGWRELVLGDLVVREISGSHSTLLQEPLVRHLGVALQRAIDDALAFAPENPALASRPSEFTLERAH
jgi:thioesterase domain-containing protein